MYDDLTLDELKALRTKLRAAHTALITGEMIAEVRYGADGDKMVPPDAAAIKTALSDVQARIDCLESGTRRRGGFTIMHGG